MLAEAIADMEATREFYQEHASIAVRASMSSVLLSEARVVQQLHHHCHLFSCNKTPVGVSANIY